MDSITAIHQLESLREHCKSMQAENAEKDREIERLREQLEADSQLKSGLHNANALCRMYKAALSRMETERDAAVDCIETIADHNRKNSHNWIDDIINAFRCRSSAGRCFDELLDCTENTYTRGL